MTGGAKAPVDYHVSATAEGFGATNPDDETDRLLPSSGSAYVFVRSGATWSEQAQLLASGDYQRRRWGGR